MQWAWATSLDELWRSPSFPMWATLIAAAFFAFLVLIVLLRADKTMANGALAVIALLAIGIASTTTVRGFGPPSRAADTAVEPRGGAAQHVALAPALACLDGLAGESVEAACEKAVFGSADTTAAAVSYAAGQVSRVVAASNARTLTPEQQILKRAVERDRYGLVAQVVMIRDRCVVTDCPLFRALSDTNQIKANMNERLYDTLVVRYSSAWTNAAAAVPSPAAGLLSGAPASGNTPTGRPSTVDYATSSAIPPVSIMTADPPAPAAAAAAKSTGGQQGSAAPSPAAAAKSSSGQHGSSAPSAAAKSSNGQQGAAASASTPSPKSTNAQAQAKRATQSATQGQSQQPAAPVPYVPSQVGDEQ
jgi:hypothetical protein